VSRARADICWETAEGVKHMACAAAEKLPRRATSASIARRLRSRRAEGGRRPTMRAIGGIGAVMIPRRDVR